MMRSPSSSHPDFTVLGAGIVGLATALALSKRYPKAKVTVLEKEPFVARHQTGNNSGVVHAGVYYKPGSLKARLCTQGMGLMKLFCEEHALPYDRCGKVIVATNDAEHERLKALFERASANGVPEVQLIDSDELRLIEPHAAGVAAIHSPHTAIVDYRQVSETMAEVLRERGVSLRLGERVLELSPSPDSIRIRTDKGSFDTGYLINCTGLYSDKVAKMAGLEPSVIIVPFRGEYYFLKPEKRYLVKGLIYPVADPKLPFLGVHFTKTVHGEVEAGPNAVLALGREGYHHLQVNLPELVETLRFPGLWRLGKSFWKVGAFEYARSFSKALFTESLRKLVPEIRYDDIYRAGAGVRAQAVDREGKLVDDFVLERTTHSLHVLNAPSPAATASLAIGEEIVGRLETP